MKRRKPKIEIRRDRGIRYWGVYFNSDFWLWCIIKK